jgi:hypothetical protein
MQSDGAARQLTCDHAECGAQAAHRAPKGRERLNEHYWFCLEHIREYNKNWNFCAGLSEKQIEREIRNDTVWRRPTWPLGAGGQGVGIGQRTWYRDDFGVFEAAASRGAHDARDTSHIPAPIRAALRIMGIDGPLNLTALKARYKELVKKLHPDANGGGKAAEDKLKDINQAYATLKTFLAT